MRTDDPIIQQAGNIIDRQVGQMARLVDDLLDISRVTTGKLRLKTEHVDLHLAMNLAAEAVRPFISARKHEFSLLLPTETLWLSADPVRLEQVASNLLNNAAKYTDPGGLVMLAVSRRGPTPSSACATMAWASRRRCCRAFSGCSRKWMARSAALTAS